MIKAIGEAIQTIIEFLSTVWKLIVSLVEDIVFMVQGLIKFIVSFPQMISTFIPPEWLALLVVGIGVVVVYKVMGRQE